MPKYDQQSFNQLIDQVKNNDPKLSCLNLYAHKLTKVQANALKDALKENTHIVEASNIEFEYGVDFEYTYSIKTYIKEVVEKNIKLKKEREEAAELKSIAEDTFESETLHIYGKSSRSPLEISRYDRSKSHDYLSKITDALKTNKKITSIDISRVEDEKILIPLLQTNRITSLSFDEEYGNLSTEFCFAIVRSASIKTLSISPTVTNKEVIILTQSPSLRDMTLQVDLGIEGARALASAKLDRLRLRFPNNVKVPDEVIAELAGSKHLKQLFFHRLNVSDAQLSALADNELLTDIYIDSDRSTDESLVKALPRIETILRFTSNMNLISLRLPDDLQATKDPKFTEVQEAIRRNIQRSQAKEAMRLLAEQGFQPTAELKVDFINEKEKALKLYYLAQLAVTTGDLKLLKQTLDSGLSIYVKDEQGNSLLHMAVRYNQKEIAKWLLTKDYYLEKSLNNHRLRPSALAAEQGDEAWSRELVKLYHSQKAAQSSSFFAATPEASTGSSSSNQSSTSYTL